MPPIGSNTLSGVTTPARCLHVASGVASSTAQGNDVINRGLFRFVRAWTNIYFVSAYLAPPSIAIKDLVATEHFILSIRALAIPPAPLDPALGDSIALCPTFDAACCPHVLTHQTATYLTWWPSVS